MKRSQIIFLAALAVLSVSLAGGESEGKTEKPVSTFKPEYIKGVNGQAVKLNYFDDYYGHAYLERSIFFDNAPASFINGKKGSFVANFNHLPGNYFWWNALFDIAVGYPIDSSSGMLKKYTRMQIIVFPPDAQSGAKKELDFYRRGQLVCIAETPEGNVTINGPVIEHRRWYQLAVTWENRKLSMYVDGKLVGSRDLPGEIEMDLASRFWIGANMHGSCQFQGAMDEIMVFDRALTPQEIERLSKGEDFSNANGLTFYMPCENSLEAKIVRRPTHSYEKENMIFFADIGQQLYRPVGPLKMQLSIPAGKPDIYNCTVRVFEAFTGKEIFKENRKIRSSAALTTADFRTDLKQCGVFAAEVTVKDGKGKTVFERRNDFGVTVKVPPIAELSESYPICGHDGKYLQYQHGHGSSLGYKWVRLWDTANHWAEMNPAPGEYYWDFLDHLVAESRADGHKILFCLFGPPAWASSAPQDHQERVRRMMQYGGVSRAVAEVQGTKLFFTAAPKDMKLFEAFLRELFRRYKGKIDAYELWNEPGSIFFGTPKQYVDMQRVMRKVQQEEDPAAIVVAGVGCPGFIDWNRSLIEQKIGPLMQVMSLHDYNYSSPIEWHKRNQIAIAKKEMDKAAGKPIPVWGTEAGFMIPFRRNGQKPMSMEEFVKLHGKEFFPGVTITVQEDMSAKWEMQTVFTHLLGGAEKFFFHGSGWIGAPNNKGVAFAALTKVLNGYKSASNFSVGIPDSIGALVSLENGKFNAAVFAACDSMAVFPCAVPVEVLDYLGNSRIVKPEDGMLRLNIGPAPVYVLNVPATFSGTEIARMEWPKKMTPGATMSGKVTVSNPFSRETTFSLSCVVPPNWQIKLPEQVKLAGRQSGEFPFEIAIPAGAARGDYKVDIKIGTTDGLVFTWQENIHSDGLLLDLPMINGSVNLLKDGLNNFPNLLTAQVDKVDRVMIGKPNPMFPDAWEHWRGPQDLSAIIKSGWRADGIYLEIDVTDNALVVAPQSVKDHLVDYDNLELFVDFRLPGDVSAKRDRTEQIFVIPSLSPKFAPCRVTYPNGGKTATAFFFGRKTEKGYQLQGKITPNSSGLVKLQPGTEIGLDLGLDDCDVVNTRRKSQIVWQGGEDNYVNCKRWGRLRLMDSSK